jgi:ferredoxin-NADP reductase
MNGMTPADTVLGQRFAVMVADVQRLAADIVLLRLVDPDGASLPAWNAGAHVDVILPSGLIRQYSLCGYPDNRQSYSIAVRRETSGRGGSREIHDEVGVGRELTVSAPRNLFPLVPAPEYVLIAGGIGITPILSMCRELHRARRTWTLYYGGRSRTSMAFVEDLSALDPARVHLVPDDEAGLLDLAGIVSAHPEAEFYCCGPEGLMGALEDVMTRLAPGTALRTERFSASSRAEPLGTVGDTAFEVELRRSNMTITVPPERTLLETVAAVIPTVVSSCEEGFCGTCETRVLEGVPLHRDVILSDAERDRGDRMYICVSRARSPRLVLDL